jgi:molybdenum cofactor cytidylyltransferase
MRWGPLTKGRVQVMAQLPGDRTAGVVLAAGLSTRMGRNKLLLPLDGEPLVTRAVRTAVAAGLDPVLVVVGHEAARVRAAVDHLPVTAVENPDPARGMHTSLRCGFDALATAPGPPPAGAVVLLGDMPLVSPAMVRRLVERWRAAAAPLAISVYGDVVAPPILYGAALFAELRALDGHGCGKRVIRRHRAAALELAWPSWALHDLDEPGDLARLADLLPRAPELP